MRLTLTQASPTWPTKWLYTSRMPNLNWALPIVKLGVSSWQAFAMTLAMDHGVTCGMAHTFLARCESCPSEVHDESFTFPNRKAGFLPNDRNWQHEDASEMMLDDMIKQYDMNIPTEDVEFIKALIAGDQARCRSVIAFMRLKPVTPDYFSVMKRLSYSRLLPIRGMASMWTSKSAFFLKSCSDCAPPSKIRLHCP